MNIPIPDVRTLTTTQIVIAIAVGVGLLLILRTVLERGGPRSRSGSGAVWVVMPLLLAGGAGIVWVLVKVLQMMSQSFQT